MNRAAISLVQQLDGIRADAEDLLHASRCVPELRRAQHRHELLQGPSCRAAEVLAEARRRVGECSATRAGSRAKPGAEGAQAHGRARSIALGRRVTRDKFDAQMTFLFQSASVRTPAQESSAAAAVR